MPNGTTNPAQQTALAGLRQRSQQFLTQQQSQQQARRLQQQSPGASVSVTMPQYQQPPAEALGILGQIMGTDPYAQVHQAYEGVAQELARAYQSRGSQAARTQQQAALSTGLTPLEASGAGESALLENMRAYFSQLPQLRLAQSMLPAQRQEQLGGLLGVLSQLYSMPGGQMQYTLPGQTQQSQMGQTATGQQGAGYGTQEYGQGQLGLAQAAQLNQITEARKRMNELFYGGGLGPIAGGAMQEAQTNWLQGQAQGPVGPVTTKTQGPAAPVSAAGGQPPGMGIGGTGVGTSATVIQSILQKLGLSSLPGATPPKKTAKQGA